MRKEYYEIYRKLGDKYRQQVFFNEENSFEYYSTSVSLVEKVIDNVISELKLENCLRPDAKHFLVINFHQMILLPLLSYSNKSFYEIDNILQSIHEDARLIISTAKNIAGDDKEITSSQVLKSSSSCYDILYLSGNKISKWFRRKLFRRIFWG